MVLAELGEQLSNALKRIQRESKIDKPFIQSVMKEICNALLASDVNMKYVIQMRGTVEKKVLAELAEMEEENPEAAMNLRRVIISSVVDEMTKLLGSDNKPYTFERGRPNVVMFVGLQGSGKTTTCTKFAYQYMRRGWKVGLICADTFRAGAFDQLKMNAAKIKCPFFGNKNEKDPV
jgi:signal recognition particle subunit SRP54